jgi:hypothetical protein
MQSRQQGLFNGFDEESLKKSKKHDESQVGESSGSDEEDPDFITPQLVDTPGAEGREAEEVCTPRSRIQLRAQLTVVKFTITAMLKSMNVEPDLLGYDEAQGYWKD